MHLTPREIEKLALLTLGAIAEKRLKKGLKLNYPEAVAYITSSALRLCFARNSSHCTILLDAPR